jgi:hypothetical protein
MDPNPPDDTEDEEIAPSKRDNIKKREKRELTFVEGDDLIALLGEIGAVSMALYDRGDIPLASETAKLVVEIMYGGGPWQQ